MKKAYWNFAKKVILLAAAFAVMGCAGKKEKQVVKVGATPVPHAVLLNLVKADLAEKGVALEVVEFTDYVQPNIALENGDLDANFFQHLPYMDSFNQERNFNLVSVAGIHIEPMGVYSKKIDSLDKLQEGAAVGVPNDPTNEGRALLLLQSAGLIKLKNGAGLTATVQDIEENVRNLKFFELEAAQLPRAVEDLELAVINGNYAIDAGLTKKEALVVEGASSPYVNIVAVKSGNETSDKITALVEALQSQKVKDFINKEYADGEVVTVF